MRALIAKNPYNLGACQIIKIFLFYIVLMWSLVIKITLCFTSITILIGINSTNYIILTG